jgi:copper resistance protein C
MPMKRLCLAVAALLVAPALLAHTELEATSPADESTVAAPHAIELEFEGEVRLTALALTDAAGKAHALDPVPTEIAEKFAVPVRDALGAGEYQVVWRAVGGDTHIVSGKFHFTVAAAH